MAMGQPADLARTGHQKVGLVVIRHGQNRIGAVDAGLHQNVHVHPVAVQHDGAFQRIGGAFGHAAVLFDHLGAHPVGPAPPAPWPPPAHVAAADDDDALLLFSWPCRRCPACGFTSSECVKA
jgi:hypothetical protein